jgi:hypothetical protein
MFSVDKEQSKTQTAGLYAGQKLIGGVALVQAAGYGPKRQFNPQ